MNPGNGLQCPSDLCFSRRCRHSRSSSSFAGTTQMRSSAPHRTQTRRGMPHEPRQRVPRSPVLETMDCLPTKCGCEGMDCLRRPLFALALVYLHQTFTMRTMLIRTAFGSAMKRPCFCASSAGKPCNLPRVFSILLCTVMAHARRKVRQSTSSLVVDDRYMPSYYSVLRRSHPQEGLGTDFRFNIPASRMCV
eukprot:2312560-Pleurochrysis_carterae.AAC.1